MSLHILEDVGEEMSKHSHASKHSFHTKTDLTKNFPGRSSSISLMGMSFLMGTSRWGLLSY